MCATAALHPDEVRAWIGYTARLDSDTNGAHSARIARCPDTARVGTSSGRCGIVPVAMADSVPGGFDRRRGPGLARNEAFASVDKMLAAGSVADILGRRVRSVQRRPFAPPVWYSSGATFEGIHLDDESVPSLVLKTTVPDHDWGAITFDDRVDREVRVWETGLLDRLPSPATHAVLAAARPPTGYSVLMPNLSDRLLPDEEKASPEPAEQRRILEALAAMHAEFWLDESIRDPHVGLASLGAFVGHLSLAAFERLRANIGTTIGQLLDDAWATISAGWERLRSIDAGIAEELWALANDPAPVTKAASRFPWTLVHMDPRPANIAIDATTQRVYLLDWTRPAAAPPALDMVYWLWAGNEHLSMPREDVIESYRAALERRRGERFSSARWQAQLDVCFVAQFASFAPIIAGRQPASVSWWIDRVRPGLASLP
jgi:Phosphotransferase enzyme family